MLDDATDRVRPRLKIRADAGAQRVKHGLPIIQQPDYHFKREKMNLIARIVEMYCAMMSEVFAPGCSSRLTNADWLQL